MRKKDGQRVSFKLAALRRGVEEAAKGTALGAVDVERVGRRVAAEAAAVGGAARVVSTKELGDLVLQELRKVERRGVVARIRFGMVFRTRLGSGNGLPDVPSFLQWLAEEDYVEERAASTQQRVRKRDGSTEAFQSQKLEGALRQACKGRGGDVEVEALARDVADEVRHALRDQPLVLSSQVAAHALLALRERSGLAYLRYASAIKRFSSEQDFYAEARGLLRTSRRARRENA